MSEKNAADSPIVLRKKVQDLGIKIGKLVTEQSEAKKKLDAIESRCVHSWTDTKPTKGVPGQYEKSCTVCGMRKTSRNMTVKFD